MTATKRIDELEQANSELNAEIEKLSVREAEHLEFTSRLTDKNSCLQADNTRLELQVHFACILMTNSCFLGCCIRL
jgi:demethoxyubiquinone hydroxylase (CLK1/Coq7/Cat5 family)